MVITPDFASDPYVLNGVRYTVERTKGQTKAFCHLAKPNGIPEENQRREIPYHNLPCAELREKFDDLKNGRMPSPRFKKKRLIKPDDVDRPRPRVS